jgi:prevent-host-death family protein
MKFIDIQEAETTLSQLLEAVLAGENIVISKAGKPIVRLIPYQTRKPRSPGFWKDQATMSNDFYEPLPSNILEGFLGTRN